MYEALAVLGGFAVIYSIVAGRVERTWINGALVFTAFGLLIGSRGLNLLPLDVEAETLSALAELTLALVLFTDAAGADFGVLRKTAALPTRLLVIGLPLTILLGFGAGTLLFPDLPIFTVALLATMLAPTDAALGKAVVTNEAVPAPVRQGLNVESGLNDGICVPILFLFLALAKGQVSDGGPWRDGLVLFLQAVGIGIVSGLVLTGVAVWLLRFAARHQWLAPTWARITVIALAFACFGTSQALGGSGFIACFVGGMFFGVMLKPYREVLLGETEGVGDLFGLLTWVLFGAVVVGKGIGEFSLPALAYAVASLTIVRILPVGLAVIGLEQSVESKLFMGWFGPRGLASIVFVVIVLGSGLPHCDILVTTVVYTVALSILGHGLSANPWAKAFGARARKSEESSDDRRNAAV